MFESPAKAGLFFCTCLVRTFDPFSFCIRVIVDHADSILHNRHSPLTGTN